MTRRATPEEADRFTSFMLREFRGVEVPKDAMGALLKATISIDLVSLIEARAIVLGPFVLLKSGLSSDEKIETVTSSCQHLHQFWDDAIGFSWLYLASSEARAQFEAESIRAKAEVLFARTKQLPPLDTLVSPLHQGYALGSGDLDLAHDLLEQAGTSIVAGIVSTEAGRKAVEWLRSEAPGLLAA